MKLHIDNKQPLIQAEKDTEENVVYLGDDKPVVINTSAKQRHEKGKQKAPKEKVENNDKSESDSKKGEQPALKRGQKGKMKKMKEKYKDQDEEDRRLSMLLLQVLYLLLPYIIFLYHTSSSSIYTLLTAQSAGAAKEDKRKNRAKDPSGPKQQGKKRPNPRPNPPTQPVHVIDNVDDEDTGPVPEVDMLDQLTGKPFFEDELLFAVPVVAPYNTLLNYK